MKDEIILKGGHVLHESFFSGAWFNNLYKMKQPTVKPIVNTIKTVKPIVEETKRVIDFIERY